MEEEKQFFYRACGYVVFKLLKESRITCELCVPRATRGEEEPVHQYAAFVLMSNFKEDAQFEVSDDVFQMLLAAEERILKDQNIIVHLKENMSEFIWKKVKDLATVDGFLNCHELPTRILKRFIRMRTWIFSERPSDIKRITGTTSERGSKSMYSRVLVDQVR